MQEDAASGLYLCSNPAVEMPAFSSAVAVPLQIMLGIRGTINSEFLFTVFRVKMGCSCGVSSTPAVLL